MKDNIGRYGLAAFMPVTVKTLLLIFGVIGQSYSFFSASFMSGAQFMYFTNQSNITIMLVAAVFLVYDILRLIKGGSAPVPPRFLLALRFIFTAAITLTFVVFSLMLTPEMLIRGNASYLTSLNNLCVHNIVPILAIIDWCFFTYGYKTDKSAFLLGTLMPLYYVFFTMTLSAKGDYFSGRNVPYFFFDYKTNGWFSLGGGKFGTAWWLIILCLAVMGMSALLIGAKNRRMKKINERKAL